MFVAGEMSLVRTGINTEKGRGEREENTIMIFECVCLLMGKLIGFYIHFYMWHIILFNNQWCGRRISHSNYHFIGKSKAGELSQEIIKNHFMKKIKLRYLMNEAFFLLFFQSFFSCYWKPVRSIKTLHIMQSYAVPVLCERKALFQDKDCELINAVFFCAMQLKLRYIVLLLKESYELKKEVKTVSDIKLFQHQSYFQRYINNI